MRGERGEGGEGREGGRVGRGGRGGRGGAGVRGAGELSLPIVSQATLERAKGTVSLSSPEDPHRNHPT